MTPPKIHAALEFMQPPFCNQSDDYTRRLSPRSDTSLNLSDMSAPGTELGRHRTACPTPRSSESVAVRRHNHELRLCGASTGLCARARCRCRSQDMET